MSTGSFAVIITKDDIGHGGRPLGPKRLDYVTVHGDRCQKKVSDVGFKITSSKEDADLVRADLLDCYEILRLEGDIERFSKELHGMSEDICSHVRESGGELKWKHMTKNGDIPAFVVLLLKNDGQAQRSDGIAEAYKLVRRHKERLYLWRKGGQVWWLPENVVEWCPFSSEEDAEEFLQEIDEKFGCGDVRERLSTSESVLRKAYMDMFVSMQIV